ncbi:MAG: hypothetical protein ACTSUK_03280 [Promethearchaeota archaeon]
MTIEASSFENLKFLENLPWTLENNKKNEKGSQKSEIYYFSLTTCMYCKKGLKWLREREVSFKWLYLDNLEPNLKKKVKTWVQEHFKLKTRMASPFVIFKTDSGEYYSDGFDPEYWKAKI